MFCQVTDPIVISTPGILLMVILFLDIHKKAHSKTVQFDMYSVEHSYR